MFNEFEWSFNGTTKRTFLCVIVLLVLNTEHKDVVQFLLTIFHSFKVHALAFLRVNYRLLSY